METDTVGELDKPWIEIHRGNWAQAVKLCHEILSGGSAQADTLRALAIGLRQQARLSEACEALEQVVALQPRNALGWSDLGVLRYQDGKWNDALSAFDASLACQPLNVTALRGKAESLLSLSRYAEAIPPLEECIRLAPEGKRSRLSLGNCLLEEGRLAEALRIGHQCLAQERSENSLWLMSSIEHRHLRLESSLSYAESACLIAPASFVAWARLALARWDCGDMKGSTEARERALQCQPVQQSLHSNLTWVALHEPDQSADSLRDIHQTTAQMCVRETGPAFVHTNSREHQRRLRIGYLSGEFTDRQAAFYFLGSWLRHQDRRNFESFYYMSRRAPHLRLLASRSMADHWRDVWNLNDRQLVELIRSDDIDILVDLSGHYDDNRLGVFAMRPAPLQVAFPNYPSTTGVRQIDYIFTDIWTTPIGCDHEYVEQPYRLPGGYLAFQLDRQPPALTPLPALANGHITFGIFQRPGKYNDGTWDAVAGVLDALPNSCLLIHFSSADLDDEGSAIRERMRRPLRERGVDLSRIAFCGARSFEQHLQIVAQADIALDSFPYNGQTTTCDCFWMGVPVVSLRGKTHVARVGQALLERLDLGRLCGATIRDYVAAAVHLAEDLDSLVQLRSGLRRQAAERLGDGQRLCREIERGYRWIWTRWCKSGDVRQPATRECNRAAIG